MKPCTFLRDYTDQERTAYDSLVADSIAQLPFTLAFPISRAAEQISAGNYGRAMNHTLDFLEISVQYLSCLLFVRLQRHEADMSQADRALNRIVTKIDTKRPLSFGDWVNDIFTPLVRTAEAEIPGDPLAESLARHIVRRRGNVLLGDRREPSVVQIRNEYKGHSTTLSEDIYRGVVYTLEPRHTADARSDAPASRPRVLLVRRGGGAAVVRRHRGAAESAAEPAGEPLEKNHYYISLPDGSGREDLFPLVFANDKGYVYVFQSLKEESVSYISSNENAVTFIDDCWNEPFDRLMQRTSPGLRHSQGTELGPDARDDGGRVVAFPRPRATARRSTTANSSSTAGTSRPCSTSSMRATAPSSRCSAKPARARPTSCATGPRG